MPRSQFYSSLVVVRTRVQLEEFFVVVSGVWTILSLAVFDKDMSPFSQSFVTHFSLCLQSIENGIIHLSTSTMALFIYLIVTPVYLVRLYCLSSPSNITQYPKAVTNLHVISPRLTHSHIDPRIWKATMASIAPSSIQ